MTRHLEAAQDLALLLGPREADIMRLLWSRGPATVREIHTQLTVTTPLAYTTIMTTCTRLWEKGLLDRRYLTPEDQREQGWRAYLYTPRQSETEFVRAAIEQRIEPVLAQYPALIRAQVSSSLPPSRSSKCDRAGVEQLLAYLGTLQDTTGQRADDSVLDMITALLERAETAERLVVSKEREIQHTERRVEAIEQRATAVERRAVWIEQQLEAARRQLNRPPKQARKPPTRSEPVEYHDDKGICRVCARKAPPQSAARHDDLRVCGEESCRIEARRRDNNAKVRRFNAKQRALRIQREQNISFSNA